MSWPRQPTTARRKQDMSNAVVTMNAGFTPDQVALVKRTICRDASDDELKLFMHVAQRTGLDPFARQIYAVKRQDSRGRDTMVIQTSIDGFRLIAFRTNAYAGKDEAAFEYGTNKDHPNRCKVTIYKMVQGQKCSFTATAKWDEYYPGEKLGFMWRKLPETMLEKCCEAKALRMAFPAELSGVYSAEEMEQAEQDAGRVGPQQPPADGSDGNIEDRMYKVPFGQWKNRTIEEIYKNFGPQRIASYIDFLEEAAKKKGQPLGAQALEFIDMAGTFLGMMENKVEGDEDEQEHGE